MLVIGITGGTGAGKTTLLNELEIMGACTIDCDRLYHELALDSREMLREIECEFCGVVTDGGLDRKALGKIVFGNIEALTRLNSITHKYVNMEVEKRLLEAEKEGKTLAGVDAIALIESGISEKCGAVVGVLASIERRTRRITAREGISEEYAKLRIYAQKPDEYFIENCDYILENNFETEDEFRLECRKLIKIITEKSG
jgi:dephospho-CoA kinase